MKTQNNIVWLFALPAVSVLLLVGLVPLIAVFNYSFFDIFTLSDRFWIGAESYQYLIRSADIYHALGRSVLFSTLVVLIQFPLGIGIALMMRKGSMLTTAALMVLAIPLVVPWNMIPIIWTSFINPHFGALGQVMAWSGWDFDYKFNAIHTWMLILTVDTWHWIGLVAILAYSGRSSISDAYYQAAAIDGASRMQVFWYIELPKMRPVLLMALLLRVMDSLMIYTEAFAINAGGPDGATTFLSLELGEEIGAFNYGPAAARSVLYFLLILLLAWNFRRLMQRAEIT